MEHYRTYMDRQTLSDAGRAKLLALTEGKPKENARRRWAALAACAVLAVAVGVFGVSRLAGNPGGPAASVGEDRPPVTGPVMADADLPAEPAKEAAAAPDGLNVDREAFLAEGPGEEAKLALPNVFAIDYKDRTAFSEVMASRAWIPGSFKSPLKKDAILKIFWGPDGKPEVTDPKTDTGDFPPLLTRWAGYLVYADALYNGQGDLEEVTIWGVKGKDTFTLSIAPGHMPFTDCIVTTDSPAAEINGVPVDGWYGSYDRDGDGEAEHVVFSSFMAGDRGVTFENVGSGGLLAGEDEADELGGARLFNAMLVNHFVRADSHPYLDHIAHTDNIPAWLEETYTDLNDALAGAEGFRAVHPEADFARYFPESGPAGFGEFFGRLSYQERGTETMFIRWSRGFDDVEIEVYAPRDSGGAHRAAALVDVSVPESYDWRLYDGPISDSVPEEYRLNFYQPTFRAEDMTPDLVRARVTSKDTGGMSCRFCVLHGDGTVVCYACSGVTPEYIWSLIEPTL